MKSVINFLSKLRLIFKNQTNLIATRKYNNFENE